MKAALDTRFNNLEQFIQEVQHWDLDFRLLGAGGFQGRIKQVASRDVLVTYARFQCGLDQTGATPPGYCTFGILGKACNGFWWRGHQVTNNDLLVFPPSNELRSVSHKDFEVFTVSLRSAHLEQLVNDLGLGSHSDRMREVIQLEPQIIQGLRELAGIIVSAKDRPTSLAAAQVLTEKLAVYTSKDFAARKPSVRKRDLAINRVVEYVRSVPAPASELTRLCRIAGVSERTLQYAFKERYGIPPNVFVKRWNLNSARRLLLQASPATINDIATSLGFFHQGHFTADYRELFAELPSTTLGSKH
jgi:AraC family ethanolamine operon transcriptional activator